MFMTGHIADFWATASEYCPGYTPKMKHQLKKKIHEHLLIYLTTVANRL